MNDRLDAIQNFRMSPKRSEEETLKHRYVYIDQLEVGDRIATRHVPAKMLVN